MSAEGIFTFEGNGHELIEKGYELRAAEQYLRGTDSLFERTPTNFLRANDRFFEGKSDTSPFREGPDVTCISTGSAVRSHFH
jgi:hypothetical protein